MSTTPSFEDDLRAAREARGLSLPEIQDQTRIPVDVLRRFESGELVRDPTYNEVYLKAFLQSYSKAVGISPSKTVAAFAEQKGGRYNGSLHPDFDPAKAPPPPEPSRPGARPDASARPIAAAAAGHSVCRARGRRSLENSGPGSRVRVIRPSRPRRWRRLA